MLLVLIVYMLNSSWGTPEAGVLPHYNRLFEPLTTPGKEDIQELTRGFADETNHQDADDGTNGPYHVMNECEHTLTPTALQQYSALFHY